MDNRAFCGDHLDAVEKNDTVKSGSSKPPPSEEPTPSATTDPQRLRSTLAQCFATFVDSLSLISIGLLLTAPSVIIGEVHNAEIGLSLNNEQVSWYASLLPIFQPFGCLLGGFLQNFIGRRHGLLLMYITALTTWIVLNKAASVELLYTSSILAGITIGFTEAPGLTYVSEITTPKLRGILVMYNNYNVGVGSMLMFLLASFTNWRPACLVCIGLTIFSMTLLVFIPDSPVWLINKGKTKEAIKSLRYLRGWVAEADVMPEFEELSRFINKSYSDDNDKNSPQKRTFALKDLLAGHTLRPFVFVICSWFFAFHSALQPAKSYTLVIFNNLDLPLDSNLLGFLHGLAVPIGGIAWAASVRMFGKRVLALSSIVSSSILSLLLGLCIAYRHELNQPWIFVVLYILSGLSYACILSTPWILMVEIYPPKTKSIATGITAAILYVTISVYTKMFYVIQPLMTTQGTFLLYGLIGIVGFMYLWVFMPETEGKTMAEISELFADDARISCPHFQKKK